jgi:hypothetical protein
MSFCCYIIVLSIILSFSVANSLLKLKKTAQILRQETVFSARVLPHSCLLAIHLRVLEKELPVK